MKKADFYPLLYVIYLNQFDSPPIFKIVGIITNENDGTIVQSNFGLLILGNLSSVELAKSGCSTVLQKIEMVVSSYLYS